MSMLAENRLENTRNRAWICCLSKTYDNLLMWAYYTNHKGICIGLDKDLFDKALHKPLGLEYIGGVEVKYTDIINRPNYFESGEDLLLYQICTKGKQWEHEQEVRYIIIGPSRIHLPMRMARKPKKREIIDWKEVKAYPHIGPECFKSIYLGINVSAEDKETIISYVKTYCPSIKVFQMKADAHRFAFTCEPINFSCEGQRQLPTNKSKLRYCFQRINSGRHKETWIEQ